MKTQHLIPFIAAAAGFSVAWVMKPVPAPPSAPPSGGQAKDKPSDRQTNNRTRPTAISEKRPKEVNAGDFPLADLADKGPKTKVEAKMLRLSEALGLTIDQQGGIISAVEKAKSTANDQVPVIQDMAARGKEIEETLATILSPEQMAKFEELRSRERDNRIESRAQLALSQMIEEIDLSPGQRDEVLSRLRQYAREQIQSIPASATLLLNTSMLPTDGKSLNIDGILALARLSEEPAYPNDPMKAHETLIARQRKELEEQLRCFDGILTPAQMGQVHATISERKARMEQLRRAIPPEAMTPPEANQPEPVPPPRPQIPDAIGDEPDDGED